MISEQLTHPKPLPFVYPILTKIWEDVIWVENCPRENQKILHRKQRERSHMSKNFLHKKLTNFLVMTLISTFYCGSTMAQGWSSVICNESLNACKKIEDPKEACESYRNMPGVAEICHALLHELRGQSDIKNSACLNAFFWARNNYKCS